MPNIPAASTSARRTRTEPLPAPLQDLVLATIAFEEGPVGADAARRVRADMFDGKDDREIATEAIRHREQYGKPPSAVELCARVIHEGDKGQRQRRKRIAVLKMTADTTNPEFVADRLSDFLRIQTLKDALSGAVDRLLSGTEEGRAEDVEHILRPALDSTARTGSLVARAASTFKTRKTFWIDEPFFLLGEINLITGEGGIGKTLVALDTAACIARKAEMATIFLTIEDDPGADLKPRFVAARGNPELLLFIGKEDREDKEEFDLVDTLDEDRLAEIERIIVERGDVAMVVIDPLVDFSKRGVNHYSEADVRAMLKPLRRLARRHDLALVIVVHFNKKQDLKATGRTSGSVAFRNVPRSAMMVLADPDEPGRILLIQTKHNKLAIDADNAAAFWTRPRRGVPVIEWEEGLYRLDPDEVLQGRAGRPSKQEEARELLCEMLAGGPVAARELEASLEAAGISWATVKKVKDDAGVVSYQKGRQWFWKLRT